MLTFIFEKWLQMSRIGIFFSRKLTLKAAIYPGNPFSWKHSSSIMFRLLEWKYSPLEFGLQIPRPTPHHSFTIMFSWSRISKGKISSSFQEKGVCQTSNTADRAKTCHSWDVGRVWLCPLFINIPLKFVEKCVQSGVIITGGEKYMQNCAEVQWKWWLFTIYFYSMWIHFTEKCLLMHVKREQTH